MLVRCPHCQNPIDVVDDKDFEGIGCPSCGSTFSLVADATMSLVGRPAANVGHFELLDRLGQGAFGTVWKARDGKLDRLVALKLPRREQLSPGDREQFLREARAAAQLRHANIVAVHEVGLHDGSVYIVSDLIEGVSLSSWLSGRRPTQREAAELCVKLSEALHYAHERGVVHRDLKPSNIMLDRAGQPHVMDFGLAKRDAGEITMTLDGKVLGTPAYMSPEQAQGAAHQADRRTDVYSLGVILFELLTGELPFRGDKHMLIHQVINDDPPPPRKFNNHIDRDLETIALKCLQKEPGQRYQTAQELGDDLSRWLGGEAIHAVRANIFGRMSRAIQRGQHDAELAAWGTMLLWFAPIVLMAELVLTIPTQAGAFPLQWGLVVRPTQFFLFGVVLWVYRDRWSLSASLSERHMWAFWAAFLISVHLAVAAICLILPPEFQIPTAYAVFAILSGSMFFSLGAFYWGWCYVIACGFWILALIMPFSLRWVALEFGASWAAVLTIIGLRLRNIAREKRS